MQVHRRRHQRFRADDGADGGDQVAFGVLAAHDAHRAVEVQQHAVERALGQALDDLGPPGVVRGGLDRSARQGAGVDQGHPLHLGRPGVAAPAVPVEQGLAAGDLEVGGVAEVR